MTDPILVTFKQICHFRDHNLVTFYFYELTHFLHWMKNTLLFICGANILVRLLTVNIKDCLTPKNPKMCDPILVTLLKMRSHYCQCQSSRENATPSSGTSPLASYNTWAYGQSLRISVWYSRWLSCSHNCGGRSWREFGPSGKKTRKKVV